jgi:hypothetical protein
MSHEIKITTVKDSGNEMMEADLVSFEVVKGEPDKDDINQLIESNSTSVCNISYREDDKAGSFIDMTFEFTKDQILN